VINTTNVLSACGTNHLTAFATGWFPAINTIDFQYIFASASFADNVTIYLLIIVSLTIFFAAMIWAFWKDKKDIAAVSREREGFKDNNHQDQYCKIESTLRFSHRSKTFMQK
jgi:hypothetical protein